MFLGLRFTSFSIFSEPDFTSFSIFLEHDFTSFCTFQNMMISDTDVFLISHRTTS